ncbi:adenylyl-sulfate kinase [Nocardioides sp.]|uniref:adenylyl-sulfate kinase n=1 Tax=Nocardioides sp. TaxID=35761 RepID=UPI00261CD530|nr:adenylyl-sulfate kinase [Nocardioides sp.]
MSDTPAVPQHCPTPRELDDLELLSTGALAPITRFNVMVEQRAPASVVETAGPDSEALISLSLPEEVFASAEQAGAVELVDPEGLPLARVTVPGGEVQPLTHAQYGPFRDLYLTPAEARAQYAGRTWVPVTDALTVAQVEQVRTLGPVVLVPLVGTGTPELSPVALTRATRLVAETLTDAAVVAVPLASHDDPEADHALGIQVLATYAGDDPVVALADDPDGDYAPEVVDVVAADRPAPDERGLVLFFTGLSGSGKSTLARALVDKILEQGSRTITSLDGDVVRRNLSAGLTFSKADRETNIRRIGWVAAEISRHGGLVVVSPIAPFDETRQQVRAMVDEAGGAFFLVHVATPLEECERRDRKGLYAKARRGEIPEFTGISSPYEVPTDADVVVDTTGRTIPDALEDVIRALKQSGYLDLTSGPAVEQRAPASVVETPDAADELQRRTLDSITSSEVRVDADGGRTPAVEQRAPASVVETPASESPLHVLFVCTANICRSPFMEVTARHLAGPDAEIEFRSAGTHGWTDHPMNPDMVVTLGPRGITGHEEFRSRPLTKAELDWADVVLTAEADHRQFILDDHPALFRKVFTLGQFVESLGGHDDLHGRALLEAVGAQRSAASPDLDVADPYRRGAEASEAAAAHIEQLLRAALAALIGTESKDPA